MNKKMLKKVLIICALIIIVLISFGTVNKSNAAEVVETWDVSADDGESHVTATLYDDGKLVLDGTGKMQDYTYNNHKQIPYNSKKADIKEIEIKNGITRLGDYAFRECSNLTGNLVIPDSVTSIGAYAFYGCSGFTEDLIIPEGVTSIGEYAFQKCGFTGKLELPSTLTEIGNNAFSKCSGFTGKLELPSTLTEIGDFAFCKCSGFTGDLIIPEGVTSIGYSVFEYCSGFTGKLELPSTLINIESGAFDGCTGFTGDLIIPEGVTSVGADAFQECGFTGKLELPSTLKEIVSGAFYGCSGFTGDLIIPEGVTSVGAFAFQECGFTGKLELPSTLTEIEGYAFYNNCFTGDLIIPEGVTSIGFRAFEYCSGFTGKLELPSTLIYIESEAFDGCSGFTGELIIPEGVTSIDSMAFADCCSIITVQCTGEDVQEIELPEIIKRTKNEGDILYTDQTFYCQNCKLNEDGNKLEVYKANDYQTLIRVRGGALEGFEIVIVPSGTILYNVEWWTNRKVIATLHIGEGETVTNNEGNNQHIFTENGEFTFTYEDINGNSKSIIASVKNIDKEVPVINDVEGNPTEWTNGNVTLKVNAEDNESGLANEAYSFDGGNTWQASNEKTFEENTANIIIKVRDRVGHEKEYSSISITKIDKEVPEISKVEGNPTNWTKESVTLRVNARDNLSGLSNEAYSFDGGNTWQASNEKIYEENTENIIIKVRDNLGNISEYGPISITKIIQLDEIQIENQPSKMEYIEGENFDTTGMKVYAKYNNGSKKEIENYQVINGQELKFGQKKVTISYTENGITKIIEQPIRVIKEELDVKIKTYDVVKENETNYIEKIMPNTSIEVLKRNIETNGTIKIYKGDEVITDESKIIGTGMEIVIEQDKKEERYKVVVTGDLTGNGKMGIGDLSKLSRYAAGMDETLSGAYLRASDVVKDGKYGRISDISKMSRVLAGMDNF